MRVKFIALLFAYVLVFSNMAFAQQYKSRELAPIQSVNETKSIEELEQEILKHSISNDYSRQTTARYLARYHRQDSPEKALSFYYESLQGEGLSVYAKQDIILEVMSLASRLHQFSKVVDAAKDFRELGGKASLNLYLLEANAYLALNEKNKVLAIADKAWALADREAKSLNKPVNLLTLKQLRALYYQAGHLSRATELQQVIVDHYDQSLTAISLLSSLYLQQKKTQQAADVLHMAYIKGYPFTEESLLHLTALYAQTANPYMSASILEDAVLNKRFISEPNDALVVNRQLMYYWLQAKEFFKASNVLSRLAKETHDSGDYLLLAELYQRQSNWDLMKQAVEQACHNDLTDAQIGRANVLLGIAELKLGENIAARRAFINATLQGGEIDRANQYLQFMQAKAIGQEEIKHYQGPCTPQWAQAKDFSIAAPTTVAGSDEFFAEDQTAFSEIKAIDYKIETSPELTLVGSFHSLALEKLDEELLPLIMRLGMYIGKNNGQINGDLHFIFPEPFKVGQDFLSFTLAFPVRKRPMMKGKYKLIRDKNFVSATAIFEGHPNKLLTFWTHFHASVLADDLRLSGESRQIIVEAKKASKDYIKMKLQLGLLVETEAEAETNKQ